MSNLKILGSKEFAPTIAKGLVLIDFYADWCGPCQRLTPILEKVAAQLGDKAVIAKVNVDQAQDVAMKYGVSSIPAILIFKNGELVQQFVGLQDERTLVNALKAQG